MMNESKHTGHWVARLGKVERVYRKNNVSTYLKNHFHSIPLCGDSHFNGQRGSAMMATGDNDADRVCGVCMEPVLNKQPDSKRLFAILPNCNHCFCVPCIQTWRKQYRAFDSRVTKGCPQCRTVSLYYIPSDYWTEDEAEKKTICLAYKHFMSTIPCRYFLRGECTFGRKCLYKHSASTPSPASQSESEIRLLALIYFMPGTQRPVIPEGLLTSLTWQH